MRFYNTLTKSKETFVPREKGKVGMYTCGLTVYDYAHIGNLRAFVFPDTLRRVLLRAGYEVLHIKNITDVGHMTADDVAQGDSGEDKMAKKALAENQTPEAIARFYEQHFYADEKAMHILPAQFFPKATAHIPQMIRLIEELIAKGHAYVANGHVFFDVTSFEHYGALSGNTLEKLKVGARLEEHPDKRHPWDFALWLAAPAGHLMHWPSPWSEGYPGWHIECSAMSQEYLGDSFDIHTGGEDNIFPHHEAEIAQSEGATGKPFVRYWLHTRHILIDGAKMSKSKNNFYRLSDIVEHGFLPADLRVCFLAAHYRSQMNFTWESLEQARKIRTALLKTHLRVQSAPTAQDGFSALPWLTRLIEACEDDLNTPLGLAIAQELAREANSALDRGEPLSKDVLSAFTTLFFLFGLELEAETVIPDDIQHLAEERQIARTQKNFTEADRLRDAILAAGYTIEDSATGPRITKGQ